MRKERRWVTYDWPSLAPVQSNGQPASVTDPATWASYPQVRGRKNKGYVLGNNVGCVRVLHCVDPNTGAVQSGVAEILAPLMTTTYIEVSPMGDGVHVFGVMNEDDGWMRQVADITFELYSRDQFVPVTGNRYSRSSRLGFIRQHFDRVAPVGNR
jgi:primase-polymerase (primpol)-like protein